MNGEMERGLENSALIEHLSDQRRSPRFEYDVRLVIHPAKNRSRVMSGQIIDVSGDGIRAAIAAELPLEETLELEFGLRRTSAVIAARSCRSLAERVSLRTGVCACNRFRPREDQTSLCCLKPTLLSGCIPHDFSGCT
jgi:PilZ domain